MTQNEDHSECSINRNSQTKDYEAYNSKEVSSEKSNYEL